MPILISSKTNTRRHRKKKPVRDSSRYPRRPFQVKKTVSDRQAQRLRNCGRRSPQNKASRTGRLQICEPKIEAGMGKLMDQMSALQEEGGGNFFGGVLGAAPKNKKKKKTGLGPMFAQTFANWVDFRG